MPFPPGGTNDIVARLTSVDLSKALGQQFVIDNRGGASGVIGADNVAKSAADGYTIMVHSVSHYTNSISYGKLPYDTFKDFEPITLLAKMPSVLVVHPSLPVKSVKEFIALAKARPGQLTYASNGEGGSPHVLMSYFASMAELQMIHVPYKGGGPMAASVMSGENPVLDGDRRLHSARHQGQSRPRARRRRGQAFSADARGTPNRRSRPSRLCDGRMDRRVCAGQDTEGNH